MNENIFRCERGPVGGAWKLRRPPSLRRCSSFLFFLIVIIIFSFFFFFFVLSSLTCQNVCPKDLELKRSDGPWTTPPKRPDIPPDLSGPPNPPELIILILGTPTESGGLPNRRIWPPDRRPLGREMLLSFSFFFSASSSSSFSFLLLFLLLLLLLLLLLSPFPFPSRPLLLVCLLLFLLLSFSLPLVLALLLRLLLFSSSSSSFSFSFSFSPCASPVLRDEKNEDAFEVTDVLIRGRRKEGGYDG